MRRRRFNLALLTGALVGLASRRARAGAPRVLILGDSHIAGSFGAALQAQLEQQAGAVVERQGKNSSGLARPDFYDWMEVGARLHAELEPQLVVSLLGGNDAQGLYMPERAHDPREWIRWGEPDWDGEYRRRVHAFAARVAPQREHLVWIGTPQVRDDQLNARVRHINDLILRELALRPRARYLGTWTLLAKDGHYIDELEIEGVRRRVRAPDGIHISRAGGRYLARRLLPRVTELL